MTFYDCLPSIISSLILVIGLGVLAPFMNALAPDLIASFKNRLQADDVVTKKTSTRSRGFPGIWLLLAVLSTWLLVAYSVWRFHVVTTREFPSPLDPKDVSDLIAVHINFHFSFITFVFAHTVLFLAWRSLRKLKPAIQTFAQTYADKEQSLRDFVEHVEANIYSLQCQTRTLMAEADQQQVEKTNDGEAGAGQTGSGGAGEEGGQGQDG